MKLRSNRKAKRGLCYPVNTNRGILDAIVMEWAERAPYGICFWMPNITDTKYFDFGFAEIA
jgi:hypothetical protein